jgi:hypothetical protein
MESADQSATQFPQTIHATFEITKRKLLPFETKILRNSRMNLPSFRSIFEAIRGEYNRSHSEKAQEQGSQPEGAR